MATLENGESKNSELHRENDYYMDNYETLENHKSFAALASDAQSAVVSEGEYNQVSELRPKITSVPQQDHSSPL